jgi:hypothetical protein
MIVMIVIYRPRAGAGMRITRASSTHTQHI